MSQEKALARVDFRLKPKDKEHFLEICEYRGYTQTELFLLMLDEYYEDLQQRIFMDIQLTSKRV